MSFSSTCIWTPFILDVARTQKRCSQAIIKSGKDDDGKEASGWNRLGGPSITGDLHPQCIAILIEKQSGIDREILGYQDTQQVQVSQRKSVQQR